MKKLLTIDRSILISADEKTKGRDMVEIWKN